jgi:Dihydrouridine synthase (Dus)
MRGKFMLAPLEGVSDGGFRKVCAFLGSSCSWTEMIRGSSLASNNRSTLDLIDTFDEISTGVQLYIKSPKELIAGLDNLVALAGELVCSHAFAIVTLTTFHDNYTSLLRLFCFNKVHNILMCQLVLATTSNQGLITATSRTYS